MAFKFLIALSIISVACAGLVPAAEVYHAAPTYVKTVAPVTYAAQPVLTKSHDEYDPHPQYKFSYDVQDSLSGDSKSQTEERDGDVVHGEYSLIDADGYRRTVQYTADPIHGFQADVHREPLIKTALVNSVAPVAHYNHPTVLKTVVPYAQQHYTAPTYVKTVQPVAHYATPTLVKHISPVSHYASPAVIKTVSPVTTYAHQPVYTSYSAPASYVTHH